MFDPTALQIGGVSLIVLLPGLVQFFKELFNMQGKAVTVLSASLGVLLYVAYSLMGVVPEPYGQVLQIVIGSLAFGLSASGYYKLAKSLSA